MSWRESDSPWARAIRRRIRVYAVGGIMVVASTIGVVFLVPVIAQLMVPLPAGIDLSLPLLSLPFLALFLMCLVVFTFGLRRMKIEKTVLRKVPTRDGMLCPGCRAELPLDTDEGRCGRCDSPYTRSALQEYWVDYALAPARVRPWGGRLPWYRRPTAWFWQSRQRADTAVLVQVITLAILLTAIYLTCGIGHATRVVPVLLGMGLISMGFYYVSRHRLQGVKSHHCVRCDYQRAPQGPVSPRCPECGADWLQPGGIVAGKLPPRHADVQRGAVLFVIAALVVGGWLVSAFRSVGRTNWLIRVVPTTALIYDLRAQPHGADAWDELTSRSLDADDEKRLAAALLDQRLKTDYLDTARGAWLWSRVTSGTLPEALADRYFHEMFESEIVVDSQAQVGVPMRIRLQPRYRYSHMPMGVDDVVYFGGFFVGDDPTTHEQSANGMQCTLLDNAEYRKEMDFTPKASGPLRIRAIYYLAVGLRLARHDARWHADHTATIPATAVWSRRFEVETVIHVSKQ